MAESSPTPGYAGIPAPAVTRADFFDGIRLGGQFLAEAQSLGYTACCMERDTEDPHDGGQRVDVLLRYLHKVDSEQHLARGFAAVVLDALICGTAHEPEYYSALTLDDLGLSAPDAFSAPIHFQPLTSFADDAGPTEPSELPTDELLQSIANTTKVLAQAETETGNLADNALSKVSDAPEHAQCRYAIQAVRMHLQRQFAVHRLSGLVRALSERLQPGLSVEGGAA